MTLGRQAARMHWIAVGRVDGGNGTKDVCYGRDGIEAAVSYQDGNVRLIHPMSDKVFPDFVELERWLASSHKGETATG